MASVTITVPNSDWSVAPSAVAWQPAVSGHINLGDTLSTDGSTTLYLARFQLPRSGSTVLLRLSDGTEAGFNAGPDFSDLMESQGTITFTASDGSSLVITGIGDSSEPYSWQPSNAADIRAFANTVAGLADRSMTVEFDDQGNEPPTITNLTATPTSVAAGDDVALSATVTDPDMDMLTYSWTASPNVGSFDDPAALNTTWTAHEPLLDQNVMLTLYVFDGTEGNTASVSVSVAGRLIQSSTGSPYLVLVDVNEDGTYGADIYPQISGLQFSAGSSGARRSSISAARGMLNCRLNNSNNLYAVSDLENKPILVRRNGVYLWGGTIDDVEDMSEKGTRRELRVSALGILATLGRSVDVDISRTGEIPASEAVSLLTGQDFTEPSPQEVSNWSVDAGDAVLQELLVIQDSSGTRVYEDGFGDLQLAGQGITDLWDLTISDDQPEAGDKLSRRFRKDKPKSGIINAAVIDGTRYTDGDSVTRYGEVLHPSTFEFAVSTQAATIAAEQFSLYAEPADIFRISILLEQLVGAGNTNEILGRLHYGNESILKVRQKGVESFVEILKVGHTIGRGERHIINLELRERSFVDISLSLQTQMDRTIGYLATLPALSTDGLRPIIGHKIQFRVTGTTDWTDADSSETGLIASDTFTIPAGDAEYDVRAVALSSSGDEQTTITHSLKAVWGTPHALGSTWSGGAITGGIPLPFNVRIRQYRIRSDKILEAASELPIIGFDFEARYLMLPQGLDSRLYATTRGIAPREQLSGQTATSNFGALVLDNPPLYSGGGGLTSASFFQAVRYPDALGDPVGAQLRYRPVFRTAGRSGNVAAIEWQDSQRGLWTPWQDSLSIPTTGY